MRYKDQRVKLMSEILYGIRVLKFHAWETFFMDRVNGRKKHRFFPIFLILKLKFFPLFLDIRNKELKNLKGRKYLDAMCVYFWATTPVLVSLFSFGTFVLLGNTLTAAKVQSSLKYIQNGPIYSHFLIFFRYLPV